MWSDIWPYLAAILPTIGVAILFYFLMKNILEGDRRERLAQSKWEAEQDRRHAEQARRGDGVTRGDAGGTVPDEATKAPE